MVYGICMVVLPFLSSLLPSDFPPKLATGVVFVESLSCSGGMLQCCGRGDPRLTILVSRSLVASTSLVVATAPSVA